VWVFRSAEAVLGSHLVVGRNTSPEYGTMTFATFQVPLYPGSGLPPKLAALIGRVG